MGEPRPSNVTLLSALRQLQCFELELYVQDWTLHWRFLLPPDNDPGKSRGVVQIERHPPVRHLIELLADVQQLLADLRPDESVQREVVNYTLYRVAAQLGDKLYEILFRDDSVRAALEQGLKLGNSGTHFLRIELEFSGESAYMAGWPWEYLHRPGQPGKPESGEFIALSTNLVLNRILKNKLTAPFSTRNPSLVLVVSRPYGLGPVECEDIVGVATRLEKEGVLLLHNLIEPPWEGHDAERNPIASWEAFKQIITEHRPHVIHFIGHGRLTYKAEKNTRAGQLAFVSSGGRPHWIDEEDLANLLGYDKLRLVFLQACESAKTDSKAESSGVARSLALRMVPAVVAMQAKVQNIVASKFACTFYENLQAGLPIDWAVMKGREAINALENVPEWERKLSFGVPVVYLSSYQGLIDLTPDEGRSAVPSTEPRRDPISEAIKCPLCGRVLKRRSTFCTNPKCGVQLLCDNPARRSNPCRPLDDPSVEGTRCGDCRYLIPPLGAAPAATSDGLLTQPTLLPGIANPPADRNLPPDKHPDPVNLQKELRAKYPIRGPGDAGG